MNRDEAIDLKAGPVSLLFEGGALRNLMICDVEFLRSVYITLRDAHGNPVPFDMSDFSIDRGEERFSISFAARQTTPEIDFLWRVAMRGDEDGTIGVEINGKAMRSFQYRRAGLCVLHPLSLCRGALCTIEKTGGSTERKRFPDETIAPWPLFTNIVSMKNFVSDNVDCTVRLSGGVFETEDQRNWTDASFKTYTPPIARQQVMEFATGETVEQGVTVSVSVPCIKKRKTEKPLTVDCAALFAHAGPPVRIGASYSPEMRTQGSVMEKISELGLSHLRFDVDPARGNVDSDLSRVSRVCEKMGCHSEIALHITDEFEDELSDIAPLFRACEVPPGRVLLVHDKRGATPSEAVDAALRSLDGLVDADGVSTGTGRHFADLNRASPLEGRFHAVFFGATPQVHASDCRTVMQNLDGLRQCILNARTIANGKPVALSPLTLRLRKDPLRPRREGGDDPRQRGLFGAAWLAGSIAACIRARLETLTLFTAITGNGGVMSEKGEELFALYHVLSSGILHAESAASTIISADEPTIAATAFSTSWERVLLLANLTAQTRTISLAAEDGVAVIAFLDEDTLPFAASNTRFWPRMSSPWVRDLRAGADSLSLKPYAVARIAFAR